LRINWLIVGTNAPRLLLAYAHKKLLPPCSALTSAV